MPPHHELREGEGECPSWRDSSFGLGMFFGFGTGVEGVED